MPFFDLTLFLLGQLPEYLSQMPPQFLVQRFTAILGNKHHMIFALPLCMV